MANDLVGFVNRDWLVSALQDAAGDDSVSFFDSNQGMRDENAVQTITGLLLVQEPDARGVPVIGEAAVGEIRDVLNEYVMRTLESYNHLEGDLESSQGRYNPPDTGKMVKACFARACRNVKAMISDPQAHEQEIIRAVRHLQMSLGQYHQMPNLQASVFSPQNKLNPPT
ncbi:MAG: hypothetical protein R3E13_07445 [Alphaproteobacteria bacterium]